MSLKDLSEKLLQSAKSLSDVYSDSKDRIDDAFDQVKNLAGLGSDLAPKRSEVNNYVLPQGYDTVISTGDVETICKSRKILEGTPFIVRLTDKIGAPLERGMKSLPEKHQNKIAEVTSKSLRKALENAVSTLDSEQRESRKGLHMFAAAATGAVGGAFGLYSIAIELPISTTIMLRSIADIAREQGEDIRSEEVILQCLSVFSLSGNGPDGLGESPYYAVRASLAGLITEAATYLASKKTSQAAALTAPVLITLLSRIAARFNVQVSEMAMAQLIPIIGAAGGATINTLFIDHYQDIATAHFSIRKLERKYGQHEVKNVFNSLIFFSSKKSSEPSSNSVTPE